VAYLEFFKAASGGGLRSVCVALAVEVAHYGFDFVHRLEGGPLAGFVDGQDETSKELFLGEHAGVAVAVAVRN
jgi:hypothetical protein